jgi:hypothetical protein
VGISDVLNVMFVAEENLVNGKGWDSSVNDDSQNLVHFNKWKSRVGNCDDWRYVPDIRKVGHLGV